MEYRLNAAATECAVFPPHQHKQYEIVLFIEGTGTLYINKELYHFRPGTVAITPPNTEHSSQTEGKGRRIYIQGDFESVFPSDRPLVFCEEESGDCRQLAELIVRNRFGNANYVNALCHAFLQRVAVHYSTEDTVHRAVQQIVQALSDRCLEASCNITSILQESGYAVDYIRARFKRVTGKTPHAFLTELRVRHACFLMELYRASLPLLQIGEQCGYTDYAQFSKTFKAVTGCTPRDYQKMQF